MQTQIRTTADSRRVMNDFIALPDRIYSDCPQYVPDLRSDIRAIFSKRSNPALAFCDICGFVAYQDGEPAGRVLAMINHRANKKWNKKGLRLCYLEYTDNIEVLSALLSAAAEWGKERGMTIMEGPMGFTDFDKEGMLIDDFQLPGSALTSYNLPYYPRLMEEAGMKKATDWVSVRVNIPESLPERFVHAARLVEKIYGFRVRVLTNHEIRHEGYRDRIFDVLDRAYSPLFGYTPFTSEQRKDMERKYLHLLDKQLMPTVEDKNGKLIGLAITMESLTEVMQKVKGRLFPTGWMHLLRVLRPGYSDTVEMLLIAVDPDYQGLGVNALLFNHLFNVYKQRGYRYAETGPQLEQNQKELSQWEPFAPQIIKRRRCYYKDI